MEKLISLAYANKTKQIIEILEKNPSINVNEDPRFIGNICDNNNLVLLRYLLEESILNTPVDIHAGGEMALCCAIYNKQSKTNLEMVKYLLTSPSLKEHSNLFFEVNKEYRAFIFLFKLKEYESSLLLIDYLGKEYAIERKNSEIYEILMDYADADELREQNCKNLISAINNEQDEKYKKELQDVFKKCLTKYTYSEEMLDYLMFDYAKKHKEIPIYDYLLKYSHKKDKYYYNHMNKNLIVLFEKEEDYELKEKFKNGLKNNLATFDVTEKMLNFLMLEYGVKNSDMEIYEDIVKKSYYKDNEFNNYIKNNLISLLERKNSPELHEQLEMALKKIDSKIYIKYLLHKDLNKNLEIGASIKINKI